MILVVSRGPNRSMYWFVSILPAEHSSRETQSLSTVSLPCSLDHATLHISQWGFYGLFFLEQEVVIPHVVPAVDMLWNKLSISFVRVNRVSLDLQFDVWLVCPVEMEVPRTASRAPSVNQVHNKENGQDRPYYRSPRVTHCAS